MLRGVEGHRKHILCSHALRCSHVPIQKTHEKGASKIQPKIWMDRLMQASIFMQNLRMNKSFDKEKTKKRKSGCGLLIEVNSAPDPIISLFFPFFVSPCRIFRSSTNFAWRWIFALSIYSCFWLNFSSNISRFFEH